MNPFLGEIRIFGGNFAPRGWAICDGRLLSIPQNTALFSLFGTYYGGDGKTTFGLPDLRGNVPIDQGQGQGLSERFVGDTGGVQTITLIDQEMATHTHQMMAALDPADHRQPIATASLAISNPGTIYQSDATTNLTKLAPQILPSVGSNGAHDNMQPYLVLNFIVAMQGIYPQRQ